ncbi:MAG: hypothetical protein ABSC19_04085 [Syntrophorhabdales bacterium]|jgi:hypothetical protein
MLRFPDGTQVRVNGLSEILANLYSEGRQVNQETAEEIINMLEAQNNFIPSSYHARKEYAYVLLKEFRQYVNERADAGTWR